MAQMVRIGHTLNDAEKQHVARRRAIVQQCLRRNNIPCTQDKVPNIAVIGSGGGERAMVGMLASVLQLGKEDLLDCMMYMSGVSGSTWCMASLYKHSNYSSNLKNVTDVIVRRLGGDAVSWPECNAKLKKYYEETDNYSMTHFWSATVVPVFVKEIDENVLSVQKEKHSMDPYPIFTVIDKEVKQRTRRVKDVWVEMTPDEAGCSLTGAFVDQKYFGSQFAYGSFREKQPEMDMLYVQGMCGSALADGQEIWKAIKEWWNNLFGNKKCICQACEVLQTLLEMNVRASEGKDYSDLAQKINTLLKGKLDGTGKQVYLPINQMKMGQEAAKNELRRYTLVVCESFSHWYKDKKCTTSIADWWTWTKIYTSTTLNVVTWTWGTTYNFLHNMRVNEVDNGVLASPTRNYEDAGLLLNSPYFSVTRPERDIDLIISLDFSDGDPMMTIEDAHKLSREMGIAFPEVRFPDNDRSKPKDFYVFPGDSRTPTVIHMPLFNIVNCGGKLEEIRAKYPTFRWRKGFYQAYSPDDISEVMEKAAANVRNNKARLLEEIKKAVNKRKSET